MNRLRGTVHRLQTSGEITHVEVRVADHVFHAVVLDAPETVPYLRVRAPVDVLFKESEVFLARPPLGPISTRNRFPGRVRRIVTGRILARVEIVSDVGVIESLVTRQAVEDLGLREGDNIIWLVKTTEVSLMACAENSVPDTGSGMNHESPPVRNTGSPDL